MQIGDGTIKDISFMAYYIPNDQCHLLCPECFLQTNSLSDYFAIHADKMEYVG